MAKTFFTDATGDEYSSLAAAIKAAKDYLDSEGDGVEKIIISELVPRVSVKLLTDFVVENLKQ